MPEVRSIVSWTTFKSGCSKSPRAVAAEEGRQAELGEADAIAEVQRSARELVNGALQVARVTQNVPI